MKKVIAITSLALTVVMLAAALCACGDNGSSNVDSAIVSTWKNHEGGSDNYFTFNSDGTGTYSRYAYNYNHDNGTFTFSAKNGNFELTPVTGTYMSGGTGTYKIEGNTLTIEYNGEYSYTVTYTKA